MRYIAIHDLRPEPTWIVAARKAADEVRKAEPKNRSDLIKKYDEIWAKLKDSLWALSYGKCWYCESIDARSDNAVDHYRPKGNVKGAKPPHSGYWWLAFDWKNYRFSCTYCNSIRKSAKTAGGKQDYFPLWDETARAHSDLDYIDGELPLLLDPTKVSDVRQIAFSEDGGVGPAASEAAGREHMSAERSIERYHLRHPIIVERRVEAARKVLKWTEEADRHLERYVKTKDPYARSAAESRLSDIRDAVSPKAEYSAAVKHLLAGLVHSEAARSVLQSL